jgi:hypothetical protein
MDTYAYLNAVLDANPTVAQLVCDAPVYDVAAGPVPAGQQSIPSRVTLEGRAMPSVGLCDGYDAVGALVCRFVC